MENPFRFGSIVRGEFFFDRKDETARVVETLAGGNNLVLFAPRRFGKTSLVFRAMEELEARGTRCVYFDFMPIYDTADFCRVFAQRVIEAQNSWQKLLKKVAGWLTGIRPKAVIDESGKISLELEFSEREVSTETLESLLQMPEKIATKTRPIVVIFDEFQEISRFGKIRFEELLRSVIQQRKNVSYLFLGSKTHLLTEMFTQRSRPFFNSAATMNLGKLPVPETIEFLQSRFSSEQISLSDELAGTLIEKVENIPYYVQLLAAELWQMLKNRGGNAISLDDIDQAAEKIIELKRDFYFESFDRLALVQKKLLRAIASDGNAIFSTAYARKFNLPAPASLQTAARVLLEQGIIEKSATIYTIADPFFKQFLNKMP